MSLTRLAVRICAVEALKGKTMIGDRVLDSDVGVINDEGTQEPSPFLVVLTEKGGGPLGGNGNDLFESSSFELVFEIGITAQAVETDGNGISQVVGVGVPDTDSNREYFLDLVGYQIKSEFSKKSSDWTELLFMFTGDLKSAKIMRAGSAEGIRFAAHQIKFEVEAISDPVPGSEIEPYSAWDLFLTKLENSTNATYLKYAADIRALAFNSDDSGDQLRRRLGLRAEELLSLGYNEVKDGNGNAVTVSTVEIETANGDQVSVTS